MVDFIFECRDAHEETRERPPYQGIVGECWARHRAYEEIGYDIEFVEDSERVREVIEGAYNNQNTTTENE